MHIYCNIFPFNLNKKAQNMFSSLLVLIANCLSNSTECMFHLCSVCKAHIENVPANFYQCLKNVQLHSSHVQLKAYWAFYEANKLYCFYSYVLHNWLSIITGSMKRLWNYSVVIFTASVRVRHADSKIFPHNIQSTFNNSR